MHAAAAMWQKKRAAAGTEREVFLFEIGLLQQFFVVFVGRKEKLNRGSLQAAHQEMFGKIYCVVGFFLSRTKQFQRFI